MKQVVAALAGAVLLVSCATTREQSLVERAVEATGGSERIAGIKKFTLKGNAKYLEPGQSEQIIITAGALGGPHCVEVAIEVAEALLPVHRR